MEIVKCNGHEYEVLQVLKKKKEPQDVLLCREIKTGYKECILRMDIERIPDFRKIAQKGKLTDEDIENIREMLKQGVGRIQIINKYPHIAKFTMVKMIAYLRKELGITYKQWADGEMMVRPVIQYDKNMNEIARFSSCHEAGKAVGATSSDISRCCQGINKTSRKFIWRYEEGADDKQ